MQRGPFFLLHFALRRCISLRAVSASHGKYSAAEVFGHLESFPRNERGPLDPGQGPDRLLVVLARQQLHALSGLGLYGRKYAGTINRGLREILLPDGRAHGEHASARIVKTTHYNRQERPADPDSPDPGSPDHGSRLINHSVERRASRPSTTAETHGSPPATAVAVLESARGNGIVAAL